MGGGGGGCSEQQWSGENVQRYMRETVEVYKACIFFSTGESQFLG